jgi:cytochrome b561
MVISGLSLSIQTDLIPIVFGGSGAALPADFLVYNARSLHGLVARALFVLVGLHAGAALYHEIWIKDKLMTRMWFGQKNGVKNKMQRERA